MKNINSWLIFSVIVSVLFSTFSCSPSLPPEISITSPEDGATVRTNYIRVSGAVSEPASILKIDGVEKELDRDGSFGEYLLLHEGENTVIISASVGDKISEKTIKVTFLPAVAVYLSFPDIHQPLSGPFTISGFVFPSQAEVQVNGNPVLVDKNGAFSTQMQLTEGSNVITANATLSGNEDTSRYVISYENGMPTRPPGQGLAYQTRWEFEQSFSVKAGQSVTIETVADIRKGLRYPIYPIPRYYLFEIIPVAGEYSQDAINLPNGIDIGITPSSIEVYPNTVYPIELSIQTEQNAPPGEYWIMFQMNNNEMRGWAKITVTI